MENSIYLPDKILRNAIAHIKSQFPIESCGIFAGVNNSITNFFPISNQLNSPTEYIFSPQETIDALYKIDSQNLSILAFFHSHSINMGYPSETDLQRSTTPGIPHIIFFPTPEGWKHKGFMLAKQSYQELIIHGLKP